jgi:hypothetical protein
MIFSYAENIRRTIQPLFHHHRVELAHRGADAAARTALDIDDVRLRLLPLIASLEQLRMHTMQPSHFISHDA